MSLLTVAALSLMSATIYQSTRALIRESVYRMRQAQAQAVAEAGLEAALQRLSQDASWREGFTDVEFGGGSYTVTLTGDYAPWIAATGRSRAIAVFGAAVKTVRVKVRTRQQDDFARVDWEPGSWSSSYTRQ